MTTTFRAAFPELRRTSPEVLRMAGVPLALADEGADLLIWTEAAVGGGLAFLRERRHEHDGSPAVRDVAEHGDHAVVDCDGVSLLEMGLRVFDFACARAAGGDTGPVVVRSTAGPQFLPYLARRCAMRGYGVRARWDGPALPVRDGWSPETVEAHPGDGGVRLSVWSAAGPGDDAAPLGSVEIHCAPGALNGLPPLDPSGADTACEERFATALAQGMHVDAEDYGAFTTLARALRVPTSERSRTQAG